MALIALLLGPVATLQHRMGDSLCQSIFLDDRAAVVRTAEAAEDVTHFWTQAAGVMGLKENTAKLKVVTRCGQLRQELLDRGVDTSSEAMVLGTVFREDGQTAVDGPRLDNFKAFLQRLDRLPVVSKLKHCLYRRIILPQLLWSFWWAPTSSEEVAKHRKLTSLVRKTLGVVQFAARDLWLLLAGHWMDVGFALGMTSFCSFFRADAYWRQRGLLFRDGRWGTAVRDFLASWGFTQVRPQCWHHEAVGRFDLAAGGRAELKRAAHLVREAWRRARFQSFLQGTRHELADLTVDFDGYEERWLKSAIRLFNQGTTEERHVMLGGCVSEEHYARMHRLEPQGELAHVIRCSLCQGQGVPNWFHAAWNCGQFARSRTATPASSWAWRLGWPLPALGYGILAWCVLRFVTALVSVLLGSAILVAVSDLDFLDGNVDVA